MLLSSLLLVPINVHAATGTVSVNGGSEVLATGTQTTVSVPIRISGSDSLNGFDVQVLADPTILQGASVSLTGSVIASPTIVIECINGILVVGTTCAPQDAPGVVHLGVVQIGSLVSGTGLLFTINYNIVGKTAFTPITFNTGCSGTSVASGDCVTISNGGVTALPETDQSSSFANLNDFSMTPAFAKLSTTAGTPITNVINYAALGAFSDSLTETVTGSCTLASGSVDLTFPTGSDTLTCSSATNGDSTVTVTATGFATSISHSVSIPLHVGTAGFSSSLSPASLTISRGFSDTTQVTLTGVSSFSGTVTVAATGPSGITGSASPSMVTLTPDGSGYSTGSTTLTVSVDNTVASGVYSVSVTGGSTLSVTVPSADFSIGAVPSALFVPRGSTISTQVNLASGGSFAGDLTLSATITPVALDNDGVNNIVSAFFPTTVTLTAGGNTATAYSGSTVKIGTSPNPANTATGNYTITITATSGSISHSVKVTLLIQDFILGPNFCAGKTPALGSPNGEWPIANIGISCNTFFLNNQPEATGGGQSNLWVEVQSLGGLQTNGASFTPGIQAGNPALPGRGLRVPELGFRVCFFQTFWANGTEISTTYLRAHGPIVRGDPTDGCRGDGEAFPDDVAGPTGVNVDWYAITADALSTTLNGNYLVNVCGEIGTLVNCEMVTLSVVSPAFQPHVTQFLWTRSTGFSASHGGHIQIVLFNPNPTAQTLAQVEITSVGDNGDFLTDGSPVITIAPNSVSQTLNLRISLTPSMVGETFIFSVDVLFGTDANLVIAAPGNTSFGQPFAYLTSTTQVGIFSSSFVVLP